jgi:hypothetical protein
VFRAVMLFGLRWQAQRDTAFLRSASRDFANQLALNAREVTPPWKKRHGNCFAGAGQNAFVETQKPPITLAEALRIGKPSQKCASFWSAAVFCRFGMMRGVVRIVPRICTVYLNLVS